MLYLISGVVRYAMKRKAERDNMASAEQMKGKVKSVAEHEYEKQPCESFVCATLAADCACR